MKWKLKALAAAAMGAGMMVGAPSAMAQTIDGTPCDDPNGDNGLGQETCVQPDASRGEGVLWIAAEQAVSIISAIADSRGCFAASGSVSVDIEVDAAFGPQLHWVGETMLGGYTYSTTERVYDADAQDGVRRYDTADQATGNVLGAEVSELDGEFYSDGPFAIVYGNAEFRHGASELDEHLIKDFYQGIPVPPTFGDGPNGVCPATPDEDDLLAGLCVVVDAGDHNATDPFEAVRIIRDNGLEVTTKKFLVADLASTNLGLEVGAPRGKWRQTSFYREADGPGNGHLTYTKVRIAPFGNPVCALQLDGVVRGTVDNPTFDGAITVFPLGL